MLAHRDGNSRLRDSLRPGRETQAQIMSDLHLEVGQQYQTFDFPVAGKWLILAGDIGRLIDYEGYRAFLERQVGRYEKVVLVLGNHEFFNLSYDEGISKARQLSQEPSLTTKLILLNQGVWRDEASGSIIMGCTLWSFIPDSAKAIVEAQVSDYKKINGWSAEKSNQRHAEDAAWLESQLQSLSNMVKPDSQRHDRRDILVVTHHAPSLTGTSAPEHVNNPWTPAFATDLLPRLNTDRVKTWVFGHTHYTTELNSGGVHLIANQRGYVFPGSKLEAIQSTQKWPWKTKPERHQFDPERVVKL